MSAGAAAMERPPPSSRPSQVFRGLLSAIAVSIVCAIAVPAAATATPSAGQAAPAAATLPGEVTSFRQSITAQLDHYFSQYGDRLNAQERRRMAALRTQVDLELRLLQAKTQETSRLTRIKAVPARRMQAARAAARTFDATYAHAMSGLEAVQPILQPKLSLLEAFRAKADLDQELSRFDELGVRIHQLAGN